MKTDAKAGELGKTWRTRVCVQEKEKEKERNGTKRETRIGDGG